MILIAYYLDKKVHVNVPEGFLVFNGEQFVHPGQAKWVALAQYKDVEYNNPYLHPVRYSDHQDLIQQQNYFVAKVIGVGTNAADAVDAIVTESLAECLCGITCDGVEVQNVFVTGVYL